MAKVATQKTPAPPKPAFEIFDVEQGSDAWKKIKLGIPTASNFSKIVAQSADRVGRARLMRDLAGEIISGQSAETFKNSAMDRGNEMEDDVRQLYAEATFATVTRVGFVRNGKFGCSPDSLVDGDADGPGGVEIKTMYPSGMIEIIENGSKPPSDHKAQIQGNLWLTERKWWDLAIGYRGMPLLKWRFVRDGAYILQLKQACEEFELDLRRLVDRVRGVSK